MNRQDYLNAAKSSVTIAATAAQTFYAAHKTGCLIGGGILAAFVVGYVLRG